MTGSDTLVPFVWPGESLYSEMQMLKAIGLTHAEILRAATVVPAKYISGDAAQGQVAEGSPANLVLFHEVLGRDCRSLAECTPGAYQFSIIAAIDLLQSPQQTQAIYPLDELKQA